jgi:hypothetical protein
MPAKPAPKPVIAVRGDDRPGMKKDSILPAPARAGKWGDRKDGQQRDNSRDANRSARPDARPSDRAGERPGRFAASERSDSPRNPAWQEAPRLGDTAFRAQRDALENAQQALRKLAAQAHGEALTHLLTAWEKRDASLVPNVQELGGRALPAHRAAWVLALGGGAAAGNPKAPSPQEALLRLEMAAEVPTPAEHLDARRALQLQLLTRRNDPAPAQTWGADTALVLSGEFNAGDARRVQNALKVLLKK